MKLLNIIFLLLPVYLLGQNHMMVGDGTPIAGVDADFQAWLDELDTQGYTEPSESQQANLNQLVLDLKAADVWSGFDFFYVLANDGSEDAGRINFVDPDNYALTDANSTTPTWVSDEGTETYVSSRGNGYYNTNFSPDAESSTANFQSEDASIGVVFGGNLSVSTTITYLFGNLGDAEDVALFLSGSSRWNAGINNSGSQNKTYTYPGDYRHFYAGRIDGTYIRHYVDKTVALKIDTGNGLSSADMLLCAMGNSVTTEAAYTNPNEWTYVRVAFLGKYFTNAEFEDIQDAIDDYLGTL